MKTALGARLSAMVLIGCLAILPLATARGELGSEVAIVSGASLHGSGYGKFWDVDLNLAAGDAVVHADLLDENLYIRTRGGEVFAIQADTGLVRWVSSLDDRSFRDRPPTHVRTDRDDGPVMFVTHSRVYVFDRYGGDLLRRLDLPFPAGGSAVADAWTLYLGGNDGDMHALRWSANPHCYSLTRWRSTVEGVVTSLPVLAFDDSLYFVTDAGVVYSVFGRDRSLRWMVRTHARVVGGIHVDESGVYVATMDQKLHVLDERTGYATRVYRLPAPLFDAPVVAQRTVYQYCPDAGLFAFDVDSRDELWQKPGVRRFVARAAEQLVLQTESGDLVIADNDTGLERHAIDLPEGTILATNRRDANLYLVAPDGRVLCAKPLGFRYLRRESFAEALSALHRRPSMRSSESVSPVTPHRRAGGRPGVSDPLKSSRGIR